MMNTAQKMRDEIAELNIQELGPEKFQEEMNQIKKSMLNKWFSTKMN